MLCMFITYGFATIDDGVPTGLACVQQWYFVVHFLFNTFDCAGQIFLLFTLYTLLFRLVRGSPLGTRWLSGVHFRNYMIVRVGVCILLGLVALVVEGLS